MLLTFFSGITYSFFHSSVTLTSTDQNIAKFIFNAQSLDQIQLPLIDLKPGDNKEYTFSVSNSSLGVLSNISVEYQMTIKTYHLVPLTVELYRINGDIEELILTCNETYTRNSNNELICNVPIVEMNYSAEKVDNYKLKVIFPSGYSGEEYSNLVDYINVEIKSWQKMQD
jgi:hypothetical protein